MIPKPILIPAIRALPGDGIAGHPPDVFIHALLADMETAAAAPAKSEFFLAAVAGKTLNNAALAPGSRFFGSVFHCCCFTVLLIYVRMLGTASIYDSAKNIIQILLLSTGVFY